MKERSPERLLESFCTACPEIGEAHKTCGRYVVSPGGADGAEK